MVAEKFSLGENSSKRITSEAVAEVAEDVSAEKREQARAQLYAMSLEVYRRALKVEQLGPANKSIENIAKLTGAFEAEKVETTVKSHTLSEAIETMSEDELEAFIASEGKKQ